MVSLPTSPESRGALLPSESQRIPCPVPHARNDWQLLDSAAQKAVATVSMIDCLWEKLTKVSDDVETLQQRLGALEPVPQVPQVEAPVSAFREEMETLMKVCGTLEEETNAQLGELKLVMQQKLDAFSEELTEVKAMAEEQRNGTKALSAQALSMARITKDLEGLRETLEAQDQRLEERLKSALETQELSQSSSIERLRWNFREQMQDIARQEQNLNQTKQLLVDRCDEALNGLRRLELTVQTEAAAAHGAQQMCSQQMDGLQRRMESLEGHQLKLSKASEEMKRLVDSNQEETRRTLETEVFRPMAELNSGRKDLQVELGSLQKQLQGVRQETSSRSEVISRDLGKHFEETRNLLQDQGQRLDEEISKAVGNLRAEVAERLEELTKSELEQRASLEERSNGLLDKGLQKLAQEVAERLDQLLHSQHSATLASESRVLGHVETWKNNFQDREAARDAQVKSLLEQLQRVEGTSKEISSLRARLEETRQSIEEGLAASAMNAFQGEMRLWAKMAQFGITPP